MQKSVQMMRIIQQRLYRPLLLFSFLLLSYCIYGQYEKMHDLPTIDYFTFWAVPQILSVSSINNPYDSKEQFKMYSVLEKMANLPDASEKQRAATEIISQIHYQTLYATATPFLYTLVAFFSLGDYEVDQTVYILFCTTCFILSILLVCHMSNIPIFATVSLLLFYLMCFSPLQSDMRVGNVNQIQLLVITALIFFIGKSRFLLAGMILGAGVMFKPNIFIIFLLLAIVAVIDRRRKYLQIFVGAISGVVMSFVISSIYFGRASIWLDFVRSVPKTLSIDTPMYLGNLGLQALVYSFTKLNCSLVILGFLLMLFASVVYSSRRRSTPGITEAELAPGPLFDAESFAVAGIGSITMLLCVGLVWQHYFILTIPLSVFLLRPATLNSQGQVYRNVVRAIILIAIFMFSEFVQDGLSHRILYLSSVMNLATATITVITLYELWAQRKIVWRSVEELPPTGAQ